MGSNHIVNIYIELRDSMRTMTSTTLAERKTCSEERAASSSGGASSPMVDIGKDDSAEDEADRIKDGGPGNDMLAGRNACEFTQ